MIVAPAAIAAAITTATVAAAIAATPFIRAVTFSRFLGGPSFEDGLAGETNLTFGADVGDHHHNFVTNGSDIGHIGDVKVS
jgi:hypothetical protein